jgi:hypothetical protein
LGWFLAASRTIYAWVLVVQRLLVQQLVV